MIGPRAHLDERAHPLAERGVGNRDRRAQRDRGMRRDLVLHLRGADVLAAPDDDVGRAPDDGEVAVLVDRREIAHQHPAVGGEQFGVGGGVVVVAETDAGPLAAGTPGRPGVVMSAPVSASSRRTCISGMTRPAVRSRFSCGSSGVVHDNAGLVRPVELEDARTGAVLELLRPLERHHLAPREHDAQRRQVVLVDGGRVEHHHELRRHRREHGDAVALDRAQHEIGVETRTPRTVPPRSRARSGPSRVRSRTARGARRGRRRRR